MTISSKNSAAAAAIGATAALAVAAAVASIRRRKNATTSAENNDDIYKIPPAFTSDDCPYKDEIALAVRLALEAGNNMIHHIEHKGTDLEKSESDLGINTKTNDADFATAVDLENEKLIMEGISENFPSHEIIGEEAVGTGTVPRLTDAPTWICDPVDGTTNFASGMPLTCVSIGHCVDGRPVLGVAYAPATRELYIAVRGMGSYRNGRKIRASDAKDAAANKTLSNAVICYEFGYARSDASVDRMVGGVKRILRHGCRSTRSTGCGVLDICYVASGRFDVVYTGLAEEGWKPWDYCAAMVVAEEAGCTIRSLIGAPNSGIFDEFDERGCVVEGSIFNIYSSSMICGVNRTVVEECRRVVLGL